MRIVTLKRGMLCLLWMSAIPATAAPYPCESDLIEVMFTSSVQARVRGGQMVDLARHSQTLASNALAKGPGFVWERLTHLSEQQLDTMRARGQAKLARPLYDLNNVYRLRVPTGVDVWEFSQRLEAQPDVQQARPVPLPMQAPIPPSYRSQQAYLDRAALAPTGIDAQFSWYQRGGDGAGVTICDLEYEWNYNHADITKALGSQINSNLVPAGYGNDHGTAVAGILVGDDNGWGITGVSPGADLLTCGTYFGTPAPSWNVPGALLVAIANLQAGDVILLENQWDVTGQGDYVPIEWWTDSYPNPQSHNAVYAAIETAVANGIHVVETGGNGEGDTDILTWYGDSGAIVVGAGGAHAGGVYPAGDLQRLYFSTHGSRFDLQAWGEDVITAGFGDLYSAEGSNYAFTGIFDGTSAAGPMVAGAVANCVGFWKANVSPTPPAPAVIRSVLKNTGTPQITPPAGNIGPRPDLRAALSSLSPTAVDEATPVARILLEQNVPNPMNPATRIRFGVTVGGELRLAVYDIRGRLVRELFDGWHDGGMDEVVWDGRGAHGETLASGMYLIQLDGAGESRTVKALLVR